MGAGLKISLPGQSVFEATNSELLYTSDLGRLKIYRFGTAVFPAFTDSVTVAHNLGYAPSFFVFVDRDPDYFPLGGPNTLTGDADAHASLSAYTDSTNLVIVRTPDSGADKSIDSTFRYYILIDPAQTFTADSSVSNVALAGLKVSPSNIDVTQAKEYELLDSSRYKALQYYAESIQDETLTLPEMYSGLGTQTLEEYTWVDVNHGLGYPPLFIAWVDTGNGRFKQIHYSEFTNSEDISGVGYSYTSFEVSAKCDATKVRIYFRRRSEWDWGAFAPSVSFSGLTITVRVAILTERLDGYSWE